MHGAGVGSSLQFLPVLGAEIVGHMNLDCQALDPSLRCDGHFLIYYCCGPTDVDIQRTSHDPHDREHASAERGCEQVCRGEALPAPLVVLGSVGGEFASRGTVDCFAVQVSLIFELNGDHPCSFEDVVGRADAGNMLHPFLLTC